MLFCSETPRDPLALNDDPLLDTPQLAELTGSTPEFWETLRSKGGGPDFLKISRLVRYRKSAIDRWFAERTVNTTTQARRFSLKNECVAPDPKVLGRKRGRPRKASLSQVGEAV
jgi:predicted DNA-binding transcriptional regulator AlpA